MHPKTVSDPWTLFDDWFAAALERGQAFAEAFTLATVGLNGKPAARVVLSKGRSGEGLRFFTNYDSRKGRELEKTPFAAAVFYWPDLQRQVRLEGKVEVLSPDESDAYFRSRPRGSQLGAWASPQSQAIAEREVLLSRWRDVEEQFAGGAVPRPPRWGGYRIIPETFEFWLPDEARLNERWLFCRQAGRWTRSILAP